MANYKRNACTLAAALALLALPLAYGADTPPAHELVRVTGEKLDSGLGQLPHYRDWAQHPATRLLANIHVPTRVPGEKLDSGLAELPQYRADRR